MKRFGLIISLTSLIVLIISMIVLLIMAVIHNNSYDINDSIVFIESISNDSIKEGMGFVYKTDNNINYIVTNYHVIDGSENLYVYNLNKEKESASITYYDVYTDIAILEINDNLNLKEAKIGIHNVKENDKIYYYNIDKHIIKDGIVISLDNEINLNTDYGNSVYNTVSISADIKNGNSGGPLLNSNDEVIGLISLKEEDYDIGFYMPIEHVMNIVTKLENHELIRPNLGAVFVNTTNIEMLNKCGINISEINGVVVLDVIENSPLNMVGIIKGDIITKVNDILVEDVNDLQKQIYSCNVGDVVTLEYYRNNMINTVDVVLIK